jgi:hypothetical protein
MACQTPEMRRSRCPSHQSSELSCRRGEQTGRLEKVGELPISSRAVSDQNKRRRTCRGCKPNTRQQQQLEEHRDSQHQYVAAILQTYMPASISHRFHKAADGPGSHAPPEDFCVSGKADKIPPSLIRLCKSKDVLIGNNDPL